MIGASNQRTRKDPAQTEALSEFAELHEFVRMVVLHDFRMFRRWAEVLADRENVDSRFDGILHNLVNLPAILSKADHDSGLDEHFRVHLLRRLQKAKRSVIVGLESNRRV